MRPSPSHAWLKNLLGQSPTARRRPRRPFFRPTVEILEPRQAPAVIQPTAVIAQHSDGTLDSGPTPQASGGFTPQQLQQAYAAQKADEIEKIKQQMASEKARLEEERDAEKDKVRKG